MIRKGFTLIELLVVIAIIALLVSMLMPSLGSARDLARATVCMTQMKQIGLGLQMYLDDNSEFFPHVNVSSSEPRYKWQFALKDYCPIDGELGTRIYDAAPAGVFHCPSDDFRLEMGYAAASYAANFYADAKYDGMPGGSVAKISSVANPNRKVYAIDSYNNGGGHAHLTLKTPEINPSQSLQYGIEFRHKERANTMYMDVHIEALDIHDTVGNTELVHPLRE